MDEWMDGIFGWLLHVCMYASFVPHVEPFALFVFHPFKTFRFLQLMLPRVFTSPSALSLPLSFRLKRRRRPPKTRDVWWKGGKSWRSSVTFPAGSVNPKLNNFLTPRCCLHSCCCYCRYFCCCHCCCHSLGEFRRFVFQVFVITLYHDGQKNKRACLPPPPPCAHLAPSPLCGRHSLMMSVHCAL